MKMKNLILKMALFCAIGVLSSCSDDEDVFYYSFKNIEYSVGQGDAITTSETDWEVLQTIVNGSEDTDVEVEAGDIYQDHHEYYCFKCETLENFNPTVGHVHVPLPQDIVANNQLVFGEEEGEYSMDEVEVPRFYEERDYIIPARTKLTLERKVEFKEMVVSFKASFKRHPSGKDLVVEGKFVRFVPTSISIVEKYQPLK